MQLSFREVLVSPSASPASAATPSPTFERPVVAIAGAPDGGEVAVPAGAGTAPLVVLLHGRGSHEREILGLAGQLPAGPQYVAVRAPISEGSGFAWFANRGIGRPVEESLRATMDWFRTWLDEVSPVGRPVILVGFSGGAAFAGGLLLDEPSRFAGAAILCGTLPFEAGLADSPGRLAGVPVFVAQGDADHVIPRELLDRTWDYLTTSSGAEVVSVRHDGGHQLTAGSVASLHAWIQACLALDGPR